MHEKWETLPNLQAHAVAPHMNDFRGQSKHLVKSIKVEVFESI
jgi:quinol monooxygenase YgiN